VTSLQVRKGVLRSFYPSCERLAGHRKTQGPAGSFVHAMPMLPSRQFCPVANAAKSTVRVFVCLRLALAGAL